MGDSNKRDKPDTSFEEHGPKSPVLADGAATQALVALMESTPIAPVISNEDTDTLNRLMPSIIYRLRSEFDDVAKKAADSAVKQYRAELQAKDKLIEELRSKLQAQEVRTGSLAPDGSVSDSPSGGISGPQADDTSRDMITMMKLRENIRRNEISIEAMEQYSRRNCLVIRNIPKKLFMGMEAITTDEFVCNLAHELKCDIAPEDIGRSHQLGKPYGDNKISIIVRFVRHNVKSKIFSHKKALKGNPDKIIISENLTNHRRKIFKRVDSLRFNKKICSTWTFDGKILYKVFPDSTPRSIPVECG